MVKQLKIVVEKSRESMRKEEEWGKLLMEIEKKSLRKSLHEGHPESAWPKTPNKPNRDANRLWVSAFAGPLS